MATLWRIEYVDNTSETLLADEVEYLESGGIRLYNVRNTATGETAETEDIALIGAKAYKNIRRA